MADDLAWEISLYERLRSADLSAVPEYPLQERGKALICLRILKGWTQRELAQTLGVSEAVVSRDETPPAIKAGAKGLEVLLLQFPRQEAQP